MPHLGPLTSQDQTLVLTGLAFSPSSDELERSSSPGHGHFLCLLWESSLSYQCLLLIRIASSLRCNQSGLVFPIWVCHVLILYGL